MKTALWCSAHTPTSEQVAELTNNFKSALVFLKDMSPELQERLNNTPCDGVELNKLAIDLINFSCKNEVDYLVQPGGSPAFQYTLGNRCDYHATAPTVVYAHSERVSVDQHQEDGTVVKTSVFKHVKFFRV